MKKIHEHIAKTDKLFEVAKSKLNTEMAYSGNELVYYEIRDTLHSVERKAARFERIRNRLNTKYNRKDSARMKRIYKFLKIVSA
jgi:hypothetical protein